MRPLLTPFLEQRRAPLLVLLFLLVALGGGAAADAQAPRAPSLIVLLAVDQLRGDYLERYGSKFKNGLRRITTEGAWFTKAGYPYLNTVTCTGHATIGTGTLPYRHGMILNQIYNRDTRQSPYCTADSAVKDVSFSGLPAPAVGNSAAQLLQPTLAEAVKAQRKGRVVGLSLKPRSAIMLAGRQTDAIAWFDDRGGWLTSPWFGPPSAALQEFIAAHPLDADAGKIWDRMLPPDAYQFEDAAVGERGTGGWTSTFPHPLGVPGAAGDGRFYTRWQASPYGDEYLGNMAAAVVESMRLGAGETTDFLAISFSSLDSVGHNFGPRSHEVQDMLLRLDVTLGRLLDVLDARIGKDRYVLGLSADHGVAEIPEQIPGAGRIVSASVRETLEKGLQTVLGPGEHVASVNYTDLYLNAEAVKRLKDDPKARAAALEALQSIPGIARAFHSDELRSAEARKSQDRVRRAAALSYHPDRSGDLIVVPREQWLQSTAATTHGTLYPYDQSVPVILFGRGVKPGRHTSPATPADLAPSLAALAGVQFSTEDGRVLREALGASVVK
jgi:predicted AlkP superfamily pyrophosphatase or phosphodiesterase